MTAFAVSVPAERQSRYLQRQKLLSDGHLAWLWSWRRCCCCSSAPPQCLHSNIRWISEGIAITCRYIAQAATPLHSATLKGSWSARDPCQIPRGGGKEDEPCGLKASDEHVLVVIHARSLPEDVGMAEAAPHPARANPLESLAVPVAGRAAVQDVHSGRAAAATAGLLSIAQRQGCCP